jgi:ABC-type sugar transport system ATPase subunit
MLQASPEGLLLGQVEVVEQLGAVQLVYATLQDGTTIVAELRDRRPPAVGSEVRLSPGPGIRHVFDAKGQAITLPEGGPQ